MGPFSATPRYLRIEIDLLSTACAALSWGLFLHAARRAAEISGTARWHKHGHAYALRNMKIEKHRKLFEKEACYLMFRCFLAQNKVQATSHLPWPVLMEIGRGGTPPLGQCCGVWEILRVLSTFFLRQDGPDHERKHGGKGWTYSESL